MLWIEKEMWGFLRRRGGGVTNHSTCFPQAVSTGIPYIILCIIEGESQKRSKRIVCAVTRYICHMIKVRMWVWHVPPLTMVEAVCETPSSLGRYFNTLCASSLICMYLYFVLPINHQPPLRHARKDCLYPYSLSCN